MAILRAGPWGNLSNSFQNVPSNTGSDGLTFYPVNCAKADWPSQKWAAYYEVEAIEGCCTPAQIEVTFPYTDDFGATIQYETVTIDQGTSGDCYYLYSFPDATYFDPVQYVFQLIYNGSNWEIIYGNYYFAYQDETTFTGDECDPVTSFTIADSLYYDGYDITITDPNA